MGMGSHPDWEWVEAPHFGSLAHDESTDSSLTDPHTAASDLTSDDWTHDEWPLESLTGEQFVSDGLEMHEGEHLFDPLGHGDPLVGQNGSELSTYLHEPAFGSAGPMPSSHHIEGVEDPKPGTFYEHGPRFGGYSNADGTYHYTSDNTDRDPQTGAIVRRW